MNLHVFSDIHLEFGKSPVRPTDADVVVAAGDIGPGLAGVVWLMRTFTTPVIYVPGNHEYYNRVMERFDEDLERKCAGSNVFVGLHPGRRFDIGDVRFLATTLWTDFELNGEQLAMMNEARRQMTDYVRIRVASPASRFSGVPLMPAHVLGRHRAAVEWLRLELARPWAGKTVLVTHHAPTAATLGPRDWLDPCYASDLDALLDGSNADHPAVDLAIHGHVHEAADVLVGRTRVVVNARGYARYNELVPGFNPRLVLNI